MQLGQLENAFDGRGEIEENDFTAVGFDFLGELHKDSNAGAVHVPHLGQVQEQVRAFQKFV